MNKWLGIGRMCADPEIRSTNSGSKVANYRLAVDRYTKGERVADFIKCTSFGNAADFAEKYLKKGMKIAVEGHIQTDSYEKDGMKISTFSIVTENIDFCESRSSESPAMTAQVPIQRATQGFDMVDEEALPF